MSNAGARFYEDRAELAMLGEVNWKAVRASDWSESDIKEGKQAEFLVEEYVPWELVEEIGVHSKGPAQLAQVALQASAHRPPLHIRPEWYY